jgi:hypothetical protein
MRTPEKCLLYTDPMLPAIQLPQWIVCAALWKRIQETAGGQRAVV